MRRAMPRATSASGTWPRTLQSLHHGFDVDVPHTSGPGPPGCYVRLEMAGGRQIRHGPAGEFVDDRMADEAIRFMKAHRRGPFYCNFWMFSPHGGPQGKPNLVKKYTRKLATLPADYPQRNPDTASLIEEMDRVVGRMMNALEELGIANRTLIVFSSDNGDWSWPSGRLKDVAMTSNLPLRSGKSAIYEGGVRVPLVFVWPGHIRPDTRSDAIFSSVDFYPTLLAALDVAPPPRREVRRLERAFSPSGERSGRRSHALLLSSLQPQPRRPRGQRTPRRLEAHPPLLWPSRPQARSGRRLRALQPPR